MALAASQPLSFSRGIAARIDRLRRTLCALEAAVGLADECEVLVPLGLPAIDGALRGGLNRGALHEISAAGEAVTGVATGFALALAARSAALSLRNAEKVAAPHRGSRGNLVWIVEELSLLENGAPYGPGLDGIGVAPERLITVAAARGRDVLWAMEEALRCRAVGMVIGEIRGRGIDAVATRRLAIAAATGGTLGLILRTAPDDAPSAAATRWIIAPARSAPQAGGHERWHGAALPRLNAHLVRNRRGHLGRWILEWNSVEQRFELAADSEPMAGTAFDRPYRTAAG
jgi:protein ImuA